MECRISGGPVDYCNFGNRTDPRTIPDEMILDLGAGGLMDDRCVECDTISGQYTLPKSTGCGGPPDVTCDWGDSFGDLCSTDWYCGAKTLSMCARIEDDLGGGWQWTARVEVGSGISCSHISIFQSTGSTSDDCFALGGSGSSDKISLTRTSTINYDLCTGTLPATVDLWTTWTEST